jgi:hypothetical protein
MAAHQLADALDDQIVGAGLGVHALGTGFSERCADAVHEDDVASGTRHDGTPGVARR